MRKLGSIIYLALLGTVGLIVVLINPLYMFAVISMFAFLAIARQMNFYKIVMIMKRYAKNVSRIRFEIRAKLHTGFRDYSDSMDSEESHHRTSGFIR
jgi:hypothetical protein